MRHRRIDYKWIALSVTTIGALMAAIDSTIVILALPQMMEKLHADLVHMIWVIMAYILVSTVLLLSFGRIADMFGRVRLYNLGFVVFTAGSALCGLSQTAVHLIVSRLVQGAGAALMMVNSPAIITEVFPPHERGRALGINGITWAIGGIAGPLLGGLILDLRRLALGVLHQRTHRHHWQHLGLHRPQGDDGAQAGREVRSRGRPHLQRRPDCAPFRADPRHPVQLVVTGQSWASSPSSS